MAYATKEDITKLYGADELLRVAEDEANPGQLDEAGVTAGLANASAEIDSYIGVKYPLPVSVVTPTLERLCVDITLYRLALKAGPRTDEHRTRYEDAVSLLTKIAKGLATIGVPADQEEQTDPDFAAGFYTWERG
ncbi:gp436 family protein [Mesorhizobium sp. Cs1299R1N3]|uniref:gp436 family protein n=1 Tax=Mesorhizobium sp. Cs1299R1N3 TaxID=3015173 RepID=UPI00301B8DB4